MIKNPTPNRMVKTNHKINTSFMMFVIALMILFCPFLLIAFLCSKFWLIPIRLGFYKKQWITSSVILTTIITIWMLSLIVLPWILNWQIFNFKNISLKSIGFTIPIIATWFSSLTSGSNVLTSNLINHLYSFNIWIIFVTSIFLAMIVSLINYLIIKKWSNKIHDGNKSYFWTWFLLGININKLDKYKNNQIQDDKIIEQKKQSVILDIDDKYLIPRNNLTKHVLVIGTTGIGKTQTLINFIMDALENNKSIVFIDGKGDQKLIKRLELICLKLKQKFNYFDLNLEKQSNKITYNPFENKNHLILSDMLISVWNWTEEHYKLGAQSYLKIMFKLLIEKKVAINLPNINKYLDRDELIALISTSENFVKETKTGKVTLKKIKANFGYDEIIKQLKNIDREAISGLKSRFNSLSFDLESIINENGLTMEQIFKTQGITLFSLNANDYQQTASSLGKLIVNDLKTSMIANIKTEKTVMIAIDEFNVFASENIINLLNKGRSANFEIFLSFQTIGDLETVSKAFVSQIINNTNTKVLHRLNDKETSEYIAKSIGTKTNIKNTYVKQDDELTGLGSEREVEEFLIHPNDLKNLKIGEAYLQFNDFDGKNIVSQKVKIKY